MRIPKRLTQSWGSLRITSKFSLAFGLLLSMLLMQTAIAYVALTITWDSNDTIQYSSETQRLVMVMSRNWETVRRLQNSFFVQSQIIGADQAYQLYALPASGKIAEVVQSGATLKHRSSSIGESDSLQESDLNLALILSNVSQYATAFEDATNLEFQLTSKETGLHLQLAHQAEILAATLRAADHPADLMALYFEMRFSEEEYLATRQSSSISAAVDIASTLRQAIEESIVQADAKGVALKALEDYENITDEIYHIDIQIQEKLNQLDTLGQSIDPDLIELMVSADTKVSRARLQIEQTRKISITMLMVAMGIGLIFTGFIAVLFHNSVTRVIINLTQVTSRFQLGDLDARSPITSSDELGHLASTFNQVAETLQRRVTEVERLHVILREQAIRDALTGLFNRRYLDETLSRELERADRDGTSVSMVMLDIDHFKEVNDCYGHAVGDKMLVELAAILNSQSRSGDITCRYGGEEFVVLLLGANLVDGVRRADEWRQLFSNVTVKSQADSCRATFSAGVVERYPKEPPAELLARVDAELYKAKNAGRNCISATDLIRPA